MNLNHTHSHAYPFQIELNRTRYDCLFFLTDDRLITVTAAGRRRTAELGSMPPRALAIAIATELVREVVQARLHHDRPRPAPHRSWLNRILDRCGTAEPICLHY